MRNRFFVIILVALLAATVGINYVHVYFFRNQRLSLIDQQLTDSSRILLGSSIFRSALDRPAGDDPEVIEQAISKTLGGLRIGKVFVVRDRDSKIVYESFNVSLLEAALPLDPEWVTLETEDEFVRIRNIPVSGFHPRILQVGVVVDRNFINWEILDSKTLFLITTLVLTLFGASVILTVVLLSPIRLLTSHLSTATANLQNLKDVRPLPSELTGLRNGFWSGADEFTNLISAIQRLIGRINLNYKLTRSWTLQMAHELKTPLAIIRAETEARRKSASIPPDYAASVTTEVDRLTTTITEFLDWAELENSQGQKELHAIRLGDLLHDLRDRLEKLNPQRIRLQVREDASILANPVHLDQLVTNLVTNALKFSHPPKRVEVILEGRQLVVRDYGPGVSREVLERLGEPFNVGHSEETRAARGNGLGLAWVATVAKLYGWHLELTNMDPGLYAKVSFTDFEEEVEAASPEAEFPA